MRGIPILFLFFTLAAAQKKPLWDRIGHTTPEALRTIQAVHGGAGQMAYMTLLGRDALTTNLLFVHRGVLHPGGGIGHHFHNRMEDRSGGFPTPRYRFPSDLPGSGGHNYPVHQST